MNDFTSKFKSHFSVAAGSAGQGAMATYACAHLSLGTQFITPPSTSNCIQHTDSDCGSSSGAGGTKTQEVSDECASSSSQPTEPNLENDPYPSPPFPSSQQLYSVVPAHQQYPTSLPVLQPSQPPQQQLFTSIPTMTPLPGNPTMTNVAWVPNSPPRPKNTIFVHVLDGETLTLFNNSDPNYPGGLYQDIAG
ncbi:unnamed protein product [Caenorhabditis bovis]|uniref:Uncharacterized protein n=1 Tax=Caenorhabditis bovis TaxID=2654633 RepID=A0A8S1EDC0_9PELO|nr:unnamed protein product [Caenorhabditis bovis]